MHYFLVSFLVLFYLYNMQGGNDYSFKADSFTISKNLKPYDWFYIRVDLPPLFSSTSLELIPKELKGPKRRQANELPIICLRNGGPPLPEISNGSDLIVFPNASIGSWEDHINSRQCFFLWERIQVELTNEQISPGVFFIGLFNRIGAGRTQAKMINRGSSFSVTTNVIVRSCTNNSMAGSKCDLKVKQLLCNQFESFKMMDDQSSTRMFSCTNVSNRLCHQDQETNFFSLDVMQPAEQLVISAFDLRQNQTRFVKTDYVNLLCYARYGEVPTKMSYAYYIDLSIAPMVIPLPKVGAWYFMIQPVYKSNAAKTRPRKSVELCYSLHWEVFQCPEDKLKAGPNCTWNRYMLQLIERGNSDDFFAYTPQKGKKPMELNEIALEPLLTSDSAWTYFVFYITKDSSGKNIHIDITSKTSINFELYARFGGLPSATNWDYYYINRDNNSDNGSMFKSYDSSERRLNAYLLYPREGLWCIGLRHKVLNFSATTQSTLSVSIEDCSNHCSGHGTCRFNVGGPKYYRYYVCGCEGRYGGFDCNVQLVSNAAQRWHAIFLIASNVAAIFPAFWALHKKAFAECVIFMCSGIASALYHSCDVGSWCMLPFQALQFMDFWLSFMAVVSTFIYLAFINEASRRMIQTIASIVTALLAITSPTKSRNIVLVLALGAFGLLVGWLIEFLRRYRSISFSRQNTPTSWSWIPNTFKKINERFRWYFILLGFIALSLAALSWNLETIPTYWLWHSAWHVSIYTSAFIFLCSRRTMLQDHQSQDAENSSSPQIHQNGH